MEKISVCNDCFLSCKSDRCLLFSLKASLLQVQCTKKTKKQKLNIKKLVLFACFILLLCCCSSCSRCVHWETLSLSLGNLGEKTDPRLQGACISLLNVTQVFTCRLKSLTIFRSCSIGIREDQRLSRDRSVISLVHVWWAWFARAPTPTSRTSLRHHVAFGERRR